MAETIKELKLLFSADTSELGEGADRAKMSLAGLAAGVGAGIVVLNQLQQLMGTASRAFRELSSAVMEAVGAFAQFSEGMAEVSTLLDVTDAQMATLSEGVMELSGQFGARQTEQTRALYNAISAGAVDAANATEFMTVANRVAIAGVTDVNTAVRALTGILGAYGLETSEAGRVSDILFQTVRQGKLVFVDLANNLGKVAGIAATAEIPLEELTAAVATLTKTMGGTEEATTSLRQIIATFIAPTQDALDAAEELGIELSAAALKSKGLGGALADVADKAGDNIVALKAMFVNMRAFTGATTLAGKGAGVFKKDIDEITDSAGATEAAFGKMAQEVAFTFRQIRAEWENFKITIGQELEPLIRLVGETILDLLRDLAKFIKDNREEIDALIEAAKTVAREITRVPRVLVGAVPLAGPIAEQLLFGRKGKIDVKKVEKEFKLVIGSVGKLFKETPLFSKSFEEDMKRIPKIIELAAQSVKDRLAAIGQIEIAEFKKVTVAFGKEWQKRVEIAGTQLKRLVDQEKAAINEVNQLRNAEKGFLEGIADDIVNIELSGLDEITKFRAQEALARNEAQQAAVENQKGNIEESIRLAERARDMFLALAGEEIRVGEQIAVTEQERRETVIDGLEAIREIAVAGFDEQQEVAEDRLGRIRQDIEDVKDELKDLRKVAVDSISNLSLTISTEEAKAKVMEFANFVRTQFAGLGIAGLAFSGGGGQGASSAEVLGNELKRLERRGRFEPVGGKRGE